MQNFNLGQHQPSTSLSQALNQNLLLPSGFAAPSEVAKQGFATGLASMVDRQSKQRQIAQTLHSNMVMAHAAATQRAMETADARAYAKESTADNRAYAEGQNALKRKQAKEDLEDTRQYTKEMADEKLMTELYLKEREDMIKRSEAKKATSAATRGFLRGSKENLSTYAGAYKPNSPQQMMIENVLGQLEAAGEMDPEELASYIKSRQEGGFMNPSALGGLGTAAAVPAPPAKQKPVDPYADWAGNNLSTR